jgi:transposase
MSSKERIELIRTDLLSGLSQRAVAKKHAIARNTVAAIAKELSPNVWTLKKK